MQVKQWQVLKKYSLFYGKNVWNIYTLNLKIITLILYIYIIVI